MNFAAGLQDEFNANHYIGCIRDGRVEAYYVLHFVTSDKNSKPHFLLVIDQSKSNKALCSIWEAELTDENILKHMEDEVGVDTSGFDSFPGYFCDAILAKPSLERDSAYFPDDPNATTCAIRLAYNLGGMNLEGLLQFGLVQADLDGRVLEMFRLNYQTDKQSQITPATKVNRPKKHKLSRVSANKGSTDNSSSKGEGSVASAAVDDEEEETVVKAKKRKVGGVSIFPGKKK